MGLAMKKIMSVAAIALSFFGAGCAIHPLPEDVTGGVDTYHIARQIRCEAHQTVVQLVKTWLGQMASVGYARPRELLAIYDTDPDAISTFSYDQFKGAEYVQVRSMAKLFYDTGIAYNFDFAMTEDNDITAGVDFLKPLTEPKFTLGIGGGAKRKRANKRTFTLTDTFSGLLKLNVPVRDKRYCEGHIVRANYIYPIAGRIGIDQTVQDFVRLILFANLAGKGDKNDGPPTMTDKLTFTTVLDVSANPIWVFTPVTSALQVTNVNLKASAARSDIHEVTVGLAINPAGLGELDPLRGYLFSSRRGGPDSRQVADGRSWGNLYVGARVTGGGTPSERLAVMAIDQIKSREIQITAQ